MIRLRTCVSVLLALLLLGAGARWPQAAAPAPADTPGLATVLDLSTGLIRDTNGDGIADAVAARIIVPASPTVEDSQAATNIAARLGFETSAFTLPLVLRDNAAIPANTVPILVGRKNALLQKLAQSGAVDLKPLEPGQGLLAAVPSPSGTGVTIVIAGGDDEGTLAAANELASRLPRLWNMSGISVPGIEDQVATFLRSRGVEPGKPSVTSLVVDSNRRGIAAVHVLLPSGVPARIAKAAEDLDLAHRRGLEPTTLNYAEAAAVVLHAGGTQAIIRRAGLNQRTLTPPIDPDELAPDSPGDRGAAQEGPARAPAKPFNLSNAYSIEGWYGDSYADLIPDRTETAVIVGTAEDALAAAHIGARLGLETTGVTLPLAKTDKKVRDPARESSPILVGRSNLLTAQLTKIGRARLDDAKPGEGVIQIVPRAFGSATATVVAGADAAGTEAAAMYLARRVPYVWDNTRGALSYDDVASEVGRFLGARSGAGQAAQALRELDEVLKGLPDDDKPLESFNAKLYLETANPALDKYLADLIQQRIKASAKVTSQAITDAVPVIDETFDVPWEVDDFWAMLRKDVLPKVAPGSRVRLELRVSESPAVREQIATQAKAELVKAGAADAQVDVLSAYKQGYLWMTERVIPALKGRGARAIRVKVAEYKPDFSKKYKFYQVPSRWLHELYPVDEIVARELGIPKDKFSLELVDSPADIYTVDALDESGRVIQTATFSPKFAEREYLDKFAGWSRVDVTTGWLRAEVNGQKVADARIKTDPERFWDHYQSSVLPKIYDHVMKVTDNRPLPDKQPFHRDLDVEVWMSEPDFRIGVDEEQVSALESLHEDLYFVTLDFFDALGRTTTKRRLAGPGKIFPIIHPDQPGKPGKVHVLYAGNASTKPKMDITYSEKGADKPTRVSRDLGKIETTAPQVMRVVARADSVSELGLQVEAKDDREAVRAADAFDGLGRLQAAGLYKTALSYAHVDRLAVEIGLKEVGTRRLVRNTGESAPSSVRHEGRGTPPKITWDHIISPDESEQIIGRLSGFPQVKAYKAGRSYRGREISVMEITEPTPSEQVSLAKLTTLKPTIFITGRQHANEVSSTSHILRLAELLVTDPSFTSILKRVNVIMQPVENPDGAAMAYELQKLTPHHMLHAGRYSALGMDVASQVNQPDPLLPEALVRGRLWQDWLPDIYLNPHGYPSHEWVQQFAGYVPPGFRTYLSTRGWYTSVSSLRDPRYPNYVEGSAALREAIVREINSNADVREMNMRAQERYRKWAYGFAPYVYGQEIYKETAIYYSDPETGEPRGSRRAGVSRFGGGGRTSMNAWPQVTFVSGGTEAPDETAQGDWLNLVTKPGFSYVMAHIKYLRDGQYKVDRVEEEGGPQQRDSTSITQLRVRPVMPGRSTTTNSSTPGTGIRR
ncbi:MAG TPA: M14 family zinc carboxypeptidase [Vicinamibacterales bacterium]|nr:M14 family zinc carboxypeptidase [Vicinamibacterales bacterium]